MKHADILNQYSNYTIECQYEGKKFYNSLQANREAYYYAITTPKGTLEGTIVSKKQKDFTPEEVLQIVVQNAMYDDFLLNGLENVFTDEELEKLQEEHVYAFRNY
jgi:hypothetical protein